MVTVIVIAASWVILAVLAGVGVGRVIARADSDRPATEFAREPAVT